MNPQPEECNEDKLLEYYCKISAQQKKKLEKEIQIVYNEDEFDVVRGED